MGGTGIYRVTYRLTDSDEDRQVLVIGESRIDAFQNARAGALPTNAIVRTVSAVGYAKEYRVKEAQA